MKRKRLEDYRRLVGDEAVAAIRDLGSDLQGARLLELSSTATGAGVAPGRRRVHERFLIPRLLHDQLSLLVDLLG